MAGIYEHPPLLSDAGAVPRRLAPRATLAEPGTTLSVTGLPTTGTHRIYARLINATAGDIAADILPNGSATNVSYERVQGQGGVASAVGGGSGYGVFLRGGIGRVCTIDAKGPVDTGAERTLTGTASARDATASVGLTMAVGVFFADTATAISRWDIVASGNLAVGSWLEVWSA